MSDITIILAMTNIDGKYYLTNELVVQEERISFKSQTILLIKL